MTEKTEACFCIYVKPGKNQDHEVRMAVGKDLFQLKGLIDLDGLNAELDRLHDECNRRAKEQEQVEIALRHALDLPEDDDSPGPALAVVAANSIEWRDELIAELETKIEANNYNEEIMSGARDIQEKRAIGVAKAHGFGVGLLFGFVWFAIAVGLFLIMR